MTTPATPLPLTLIIPVHDRQEQLDRALASVAAQTVRPRKVIVVDDGSARRPILDGKGLGDLDIELVRHPRNLGAAAARNTGMRLATTRWVSFLDSDDRLLADSLELRWRMVEKRLDEGAGGRTVFGCGWFDVTTDGRPLTLRWPRPGVTPGDFASGCWFSPGSCVILDHEAAMAAAGPQDEALRRFEDLDWFLALALQGFVFEPLPLAAVAVERSRMRSPRLVEETAARLRRKWSRGLDRQMRARLDSYLWLEAAAARRFAGNRVGAALALAASLSRCPRLSLQLSPGWSVEPVRALPSHSLRRSGAGGVAA